MLDIGTGLASDRLNYRRFRTILTNFTRSLCGRKRSLTEIQRQVLKVFWKYVNNYLFMCFWFLPFLNHLRFMNYLNLCVIVVSAGAVYFTKLFTHPSVIIPHKTHQISFPQLLSYPLLPYTNYTIKPRNSIIERKLHLNLTTNSKKAHPPFQSCLFLLNKDVCEQVLKHGNVNWGASKLLVVWHK